MPEVKGQSLEEVDRPFESGVPLRQFGTTKLAMGHMRGPKSEQTKGSSITHVEETERPRATS